MDTDLPDYTAERRRLRWKNGWLRRVQRVRLISDDAEVAAVLTRGLNLLIGKVLHEVFGGFPLWVVEVYVRIHDVQPV